MLRHLPNCNLPIFAMSLGEHPNKKQMADYVISQHIDCSYNSSAFSFLINFNKEFDNLYEIFFNSVEGLFGKLDVSPSNKRDCWAYLNNNDFFMGCIHDHVRTCVVNGVYYLNVPETQNDDDGVLIFYSFLNEEIYRYKPITGDLLVFPYFLKHMPMQSKTKDFRIAVNMEIKCRNIWGI